MAFVVDLPRLVDILGSERSPLLIRWALVYGGAFHPEAAGRLALEALSAAERDTDLAEAVVEGLARTHETWRCEGRVAAGLRKLMEGLRGPPLALVLELVARQQGDAARDLVLAHLDGEDPERSAAAVSALRWIEDGRDILLERLVSPRQIDKLASRLTTPRPDFDPGDVQRVLLGPGAIDERAVRAALEFTAAAGGRGEGDVCSRVTCGLLGALPHACAFDHDDLDAWADDVAAECTPVVDESHARRAAEAFEEGNELVAAEVLLGRVPAAWTAREDSGERGTGEVGLARTILGVLSGDLDLRGSLVRADGWGLARLVAACIARVLDEEGGPASEPDSATLDEAVSALTSPRPRIRNQEAWIARAASFGDEAVDALAALLESGPYHAADRGAVALARTGTLKAARALMEAASGDGDFIGLAADRVGELPREVLAPLDAEALERAVASEDWDSAGDVLERWGEPHAASDPAAGAAARHLERLAFDGELVEPTADVLAFDPRPEFVEPVWSLWRPGEAALGRLAETLLAVHEPGGARLDEVRRDLAALRGDERLKDALAGRLMMLRLRCRRCGASYRYDVRDVVVTGAARREEHLSPREFVIVNDVVKCKRCGAIDEYEWTGDAERAFLVMTGATMELASRAEPERGREIMRRGAVTYARMTSTVGEDLPHSETVSRLRSRLDEAPDDPERHLRLGNAFFTLRRLDRAAEVFSGAVARWPGDAELQYQYGNVLERQEGFGEALDAFAAAARALSASTPNARNLAEGLAASLRDVSRRLDRQPPADLLDRLGLLRASLPAEKPPREVPRVGGSAARPRADRGSRDATDLDDDSFEVTRPTVRGKKPRANAPCPCGSGRKYKRCCARKAQAAGGASPTAPAAGDRARRVHQKLTKRIVGMLPELMPREELRQAMSRWRGESVPADAPFAADEAGMMQFNEYLIHDWRPDGGRGGTMIERFSETYGGRLTGEERAQVRAWLGERRRGWFEVEKVDGARDLTTLRDRIGGGVAEVYDVALSSHASRGDMLLTAVFPVGDRLEIGAVATGTPRNIRRRFERWLRREHASWSAGRDAAGRDSSWRAFFSDRAPEIERAVTRLCETPPRVVLATGEEAAPGHAVYEVLDRRAALEALESTPDLRYRGWSKGDEVEGESYGWVHRRDDSALPFERPVRDEEEDGEQTLVIGAYLREQAEDGLPDPGTATEEDIAAVYLGAGELEVQALSKERLDYVRGRVAPRLGGAARELRVRHMDPSFVKDAWEGRGRPRGPEARRDPRLDELGRDLHARHVARWVDEHVPALGGRTPREAASDPELRAELEAILRDMEECERRAPRGDAVAGSVARIRRELGMEQGPA